MERVYFEMAGKNIALKINDKMVFFGRNSNEPYQKPYTINKVKSSLNHMLYYFYETDEQFAKNFVARIYNKTITTESKERELIRKGDEHGIMVKKNIYIENCKLDRDTMFKIIDYVRAVMDDVDTFDETKGRSFRRIEVVVLNIISIHIKICFLMFLLHGSKKFERFLEYNIFSLVGDACAYYEDYVETVINNDYLDERDIAELEFIRNNDIFDSIYSYFSSYGSDKWSRGNEEKLKGMFYECGFDDASIQNDTFAKAIASLNRYNIIPKDAEAVAKYFADVPPKDLPKEAYDVHTMDWGDFKFVHNNFTKYMEVALKKILTGTQLYNIQAFINTSSIVSDDVTQSRIEIYYEDKYSSLLPQKQDKALEVIDDASRAIARDGYKRITNNIKSGAILAKSLYNYYLDTTYGESHILRDIIGRYNVYPLTIVYMTLERIGRFPTVIKALVSSIKSTVPHYERDDIKNEFCNLAMYTYAGDLFISAIAEISASYEYQSGDGFKIVHIPLAELKDLFKTMEDTDYMYKEFFYTLHGEYPEEILPQNFTNKTPDILYTPVIFPNQDKQKFIDEIQKGQ